MIFAHNRTAAIVATFTTVAMAVGTAGCTDEDEEMYSNVEADEAYEDQKLIDDEGRSYTLHRNEDGTETATYDNGDNVTFRRDNDNNLNFLSGTAGLLAGMAAGYYLFHGFGSPNSRYGSYNPNSNRYTVSEPLNRVSPDEQRKRMSRYTPTPQAAIPQQKRDNPPATSTGGGGSSYKPSQSAESTAKSAGSEAKSSSSSTSTNSSTSVSNNAKSGFGSAGARSASS